jgi:hypothetical protein
MDWAGGGADEPEAAAPMAARSRDAGVYRRHEAALAPQSEQVWVENLSLATERQR